MASIIPKVLHRFLGLSADPGTLVDGEMWLNTTSNRIKTRLNGTTKTLAHTDEVTGVLRPYYISGRYYDNRAMMAQAGTVTATAGTIFYVPLYIYDSITVDRIGVYVGTGGAGSTVRLALYNHTNGTPSTLVTDYGTVASATSATAATITVSVALTPGLYYVAVLATATAPVLASGGVATLFAPVGSATLTGAAPTTTGWIQSSTTMPSTATPGNHAGATPLVSVRVA